MHEDEEDTNANRKKQSEEISGLRVIKTCDACRAPEAPVKSVDSVDEYTERTEKKKEGRIVWRNQGGKEREWGNIKDSPSDALIWKCEVGGEGQEPQDGK